MSELKEKIDICHLQWLLLSSRLILVKRYAEKMTFLGGWVILNLVKNPVFDFSQVKHKICNTGMPAFIHAKNAMILTNTDMKFGTPTFCISMKICTLPWSSGSEG